MWNNIPMLNLIILWRFSFNIQTILLPVFCTILSVLRNCPGQVVLETVQTGNSANFERTDPADWSYRDEPITNAFTRSSESRRECGPRSDAANLQSSSHWCGWFGNVSAASRSPSRTGFDLPMARQFKCRVRCVAKVRLCVCVCPICILHIFSRSKRLIVCDFILLIIFTARW